MERLKSKISEKTILLMQAFQKHNFLCIQDIMQTLECNRQSAYNYLNHLEKMGVQLHRTTQDKKTYFSIISENIQKTEPLSYLPVTGKALYKYEIIQCLYKHPMKAQELRKIDIAPSYLYKLLKEMLQAEEIRKVGTTYFLNTDKIPTILSLSNSEIGSTGALLSNVPVGHPYYKQLKNIQQKFNITLGNIDSKEDNLGNYIIYGRKQFQFENIHCELQKLREYDYTHKLLHITYLSNIGEQIAIPFAIGMIIYVLEKDAIFLMGKDYSSSPPKNIVIRLNQILQIGELSETHNYFNCNEFQDMRKTMFSISVDKPVDVVVEFQNIFSIKKKLLQLCAQRPTAKKLQYIGDKIIYRDTIRGLHDFAHYLRSFGRACQVIEPLELQDILALSIKRSLDRYLQEEPTND